MLSLFLAFISLILAEPCTVPSSGCRAADSWKRSDTCGATPGSPFYLKTVTVLVPANGSTALTIISQGSLAKDNALSVAWSLAGTTLANLSCPDSRDVATYPTGADAVQAVGETALTVTWQATDLLALLDGPTDDGLLLFVSVAWTNSGNFAFRTCSSLVGDHCAMPCTDDGSLCEGQAGCDLAAEECICYALNADTNEPYEYPSCKASSAGGSAGDDDDGGLGGGAIAIIVVVVVLCLIIVIAVVAVTAYGGTVCGISAAGGSGSGSQTIVVNTGGGGGQQGAGYGYGAQEGGSVAYPPAAGGGGGGGAYPPQSSISPYPPTAGGGGYADTDGPPP